jgi:membrane protease YdiL (CAAX protease family)
VEASLTTLQKVLIGSVPVIIVLVAAAFFTPPDFPLFARQVLLFAWAGVGICAAEYLLFGRGLGRIVTAMGLVAPRVRSVVVALLVSLPMWLYLPIYGLATGTQIGLNADWIAILVGVILVNGLAEELIHRAYVFGHLRSDHAFLVAAGFSAAIFGAQHLYLLFSMGLMAGSASVVLALLLAFPAAFIYERGGSSLAGPAILHTSSNAPMMLFVTPAVAAHVILPYMVVVLASAYLIFGFHRWLRPKRAA